jgi:PTH1 family peptidyl-tRNA hydrolase
LDAVQKNQTLGEWSRWEVSKKCNALVSKGTVNGTTVILMKPLTFMNASGIAVQLALGFYKIPRESIIVVHDDKDIQLGTVKVQTDRGTAGHNGVASIVEELGTQNFMRIRVGIASDPKKMTNIPSFVLKKFSLLERSTAHAGIAQAVKELIHHL